MMLVLINPNAGGGRAVARWRRAVRSIRERYGAFDVRLLQDREDAGEAVRAAVKGGRRFFVAAGGDGTVQAVLQAILTVEDGPPNDVCLGAVALGSSNDFHKPFDRSKQVGGVYCALNRSNASLRDVGVLTCASKGEQVTKYWLLNSSVGVTAEANAFFNDEEAMPPVLKGKWTSAAILYVALRTIFRHHNAVVRVAGHAVRLTNLAVLKSPYCSGTFRYDLPCGPSSGVLHVHISTAMSVPQRLVMLVRLALGRTPPSGRTETWSTEQLRVEADQPFAVEFDGEVIRTRDVRYSVCPRRLLVCH